MGKRLGFTYLFCRDLAAMKAFYGAVLGLEQIWEDAGSVAYTVDGHQLAIFEDQRVAPASSGYAIQPGWEGGTEPRTSWSLECDPADFKSIVRAAEEAGVPAYRAEPEWVGYWSYPLLDPMGNTVEVTCPREDLGAA